MLCLPRVGQKAIESKFYLFYGQMSLSFVSFGGLFNNAQSHQNLLEPKKNLQIWVYLNDTFIRVHGADISYKTCSDLMVWFGGAISRMFCWISQPHKQFCLALRGTTKFVVALSVIKETTKRKEALGSSYLYLC